MKHTCWLPKKKLCREFHAQLKSELTFLELVQLDGTISMVALPSVSCANHTYTGLITKRLFRNGPIFFFIFLVIYFSQIHFNNED
jgi:hypothetical protein